MADPIDLTKLTDAELAEALRVAAAERETVHQKCLDLAAERRRREKAAEQARLEAQLKSLATEA